jgi:outer membrane protein assembly factor BamA
VLVDHVLIVGNNRTSAATIRRELLLAPGRPLGWSDLIESQRRVSALGLFRRVWITEIPHGGGGHDVLVTVEEAPPTAINYGGGIEGTTRLRRDDEFPGVAEERLEFAPRGFLDVSRRNLWGKNRSINLASRVSLRPDDGVGDEGGGLEVGEYRLLGSFREPRAFGWNAELLVGGVLEQAIRSSFNFIRRGATAQFSRRVRPVLTLVGRYTFDRTKLFDERLDPEDQLLIDRVFPRVRLSTISSGLLYDTRNDALDPSDGGLMSIDGDLAARVIGSQVGFVKGFAQMFVFRRVPGTSGTVLAAGARLGLATGFPREVPLLDASGNPILDAEGQPVVQTFRDIPASERFFAGGDTTVRGFATDRLGDEDAIDPRGFPKGGHAMLVLNTELRMPFRRNVGVVAFLDAGNVFGQVDHFDLGNIRGAVGVGVRYRSPIGPIRFDVGFKLDEREIGGRPEGRWEPHFSIGQAF